jgi:periplasmic divalent cation tolerance protein
VNLLPGLASHYWWQGRLDHSAEVLLLIKTAKRKLAALEKAILTQHPYDTPEIIALPMVAGTPRYLDWMAASIAAEKPARPRKRK